MSLIDHLEELRRRILISFAAILTVTLVAFFFSDNILNILLIPSGGLTLKVFNLMDGFAIKFQISFYFGVAAAFPVWIFQIYSFLNPGLLEHERRTIFPALVFSSILFALGVAFGYYFLSEMIKVLILFVPPHVDLLQGAQEYISFVLFFLLVCGLIFQLPILLTILIQLRILSTTILKKQRRIAYFVLFAIAEIVTPVSDPFVAPMIVMVPLVVLYEISILTGQRIESRRAKSDQRREKKPIPEPQMAQQELFPTPAREAQPENPGKYCTRCGAAAKTLDARYCNYCGNPLGETVALT